MKVYSVFMSVIGVFLLTTLLTAQSQLGAGAVSGTVEDTGGDAVPDATITITSQATALTRTVTTTDSGQFNFPVLPPDTYIVTVEKPGFSKIEQREVRVTVGRTVTLKLALQPGEVSAVVTIEDSPIIDTTKTDESSLISREQINELPINGRRADQFALLTPGVTRDGRFGLLSYRGQSGVFNNFTLEGNDDNQAYFSEGRGRTRIASNVSANAIQEFQVSQSNFLPEFGRSAGGGINAVVRSGGNEFHADGFWYFRNQSFSARDPLASINPTERRDQFGGSVNGPILKDKLFYFVNYEQQKRNFPLVTEDLFGILARTPLSATATPAQIAQFNADTPAFVRGAADLRARFPGGAPGNVLPRRFDQILFLTKLDWTINKSNTASLTYNYLNAQNQNGIQTPIVLGNVGRNGSDDVRINSTNLRLTSIISSKMVNEFRTQIARDFEYQFGNEPPPQVFVGNSFSFGRANFLERPALPDERRYQFINNLSYVAGTHSLKFGGEVNYVRDRINNPSNFGGTYNYPNTIAYGSELLARDAGRTERNYTNFTQSFGIPGLIFSTTDYAVFAQDQWRVVPRLTVNYGLRYDFQNLPSPLAPNPAVPETQTINQAKDNIGPRIGVAYDIFGTGKTVVRGGYGIYFGRTPNGTIFNALTQTGLREANGLPALDRIVASISVLPNAPGAPVFPNTFAVFPANVNPTLNAFRLDPNYKNPRLSEFNIGIEREIINNLSVSASFIYTKGDRLPVNFDTNLPEPQFTRIFQLPDGTNSTVPFAAGLTCTSVQTGSCPAANVRLLNAARLNPTFGALNQLRSIGENYYRGLLVEVKRRFAQGFQFGIAYTLAKTENTSGTGNGGGEGAESPFGGSSLFNQFDNSVNRAPSPTDQRQRFVFNGIFRTPKIENGSKFTRALLNGYQLSGIFTAESGRPYSATVAFPTVSFTQNGQTFTPFGGGTLGLGGLSLAPDVPRNSIYGENNYRLDMRLARTFRVAEKFNIELLAEGFNVFNRGNFNGFNSTLYTVDTITGIPAANTPIRLTRNPRFGERTNDGSQPDGTNARRFQLAARFRF